MGEQNFPPSLFPAGSDPFPFLFLTVKSQDHGTFKNGSKEITREVLSGLFEEVSYNKFFSIGAEHKTKITNLCIFDIYDSIVGFCGEFI